MPRSSSRPRTLAPAVGLAALALVHGLAAAACSSSRPPSPPPFAVDARALAERSPRVAAKIAESPFAYFRYTNRPFVDAVCARYREAIPAMPLVHLHGDAHVEQYAVTVDAHGISDFDASAVGPPVVDLARFATSLVLAAPNDERAQRAAIAALVRGYGAALEDPSTPRPEPSFVARIRSRFAPSTEAWLDRVQTLISPTTPGDGRTFDVLFREIFADLRARDPSLPEGFFAIKAGGRLDLGIGSAQVAKFLVRVEGPTQDAADDVVVEAKAVEPGALGSCLRGVDRDARRVIEGQAQLSNAPERFLAVATVDGTSFYSHAWLPHYTELSLADVRSSAELVELAEDVGVQLGRGHAKLHPHMRAPELRDALARALAGFGPGLADVAMDLAAQVTRAWERYREQLPRATPDRSSDARGRTPRGSPSVPR